MLLQYASRRLSSAAGRASVRPVLGLLVVVSGLLLAGCKRIDALDFAQTYTVRCVLPNGDLVFEEKNATWDDFHFDHWGSKVNRPGGGAKHVFSIAVSCGATPNARQEARSR